MSAAAARALLEGAYDLHLHPSPSRRPRHGDAWELAARAAAVGMAGVLLKEHDRSTVGDAAIVSAHGPGPRAYGSLCCNAAVGGVNLQAVEAALELGAAMIFLPTSSARNDRRRNGLPDDGAIAATTDGALTPDVEAILSAAARAGVPVATGHLDRDEVSAVIAGTARVGGQVVVTHAPVFTGCDLSDLAAWAAAGAVLELSAAFCCGGGAMQREFAREVDEDAAIIEHVGAAAVVLSSDLGWAAAVEPVDGFIDYLDRLRAAGISEQSLRTMVADNPARLLREVPRA
jgi:microsomal dipeptidase-like Zn-dependent dipeptidase